MINAFGLYHGLNGYNIHCRSFFNALNQLEPLAVRSLSRPQFDFDFANQEADMFSREINPENIGIGLTYGYNMDQIIGKKRIGYTVWETTRYPESWKPNLRACDQIWIPSSWGKQILVNSGFEASRIRVVPEGIDPTLYNPSNQPLDLKGDEFRFLCIGKWEDRKNIDGLLKAYSQAFEPGDNVSLYLQVFNPFIKDFDVHRELKALNLKPTAPIHILNLLSCEVFPRIYTSCHAFVLPTRAEGWGLPIMEAMASGLPPLVTNYSALTDYVTEDTGYLLPVSKLVDAPAELGGKWAEPDSDQLIHSLRYMKDHPDEVAAKGCVAAETIAANWTWDQAAKTAVNHIRELE